MPLIIFLAAKPQLHDLRDLTAAWPESFRAGWQSRDVRRLRRLGRRRRPIAALQVTA